MKTALKLSHWGLRFFLFATVIAACATESWPQGDESVRELSRPSQARSRFGDAGQLRAKPIRELMVVDSKGKVVGISVGGLALHNMEIVGGTSLEIRSIVLLQIGEHIVPVAVGRDRFYGGGVLYFEAEDCTGTPWFPVITPSIEPPTLFPRVAVGPPGQTVYLEKSLANPQPITIKSLLLGFATCSNETFAEIDAMPAEPLMNLETEFTPPFSLRAVP